jgi:serine protease Do
MRVEAAGHAVDRLIDREGVSPETSEGTTMTDQHTTASTRRRTAPSLAALVAAGTLAGVLGTWYVKPPRIEASAPVSAASSGGLSADLSAEAQSAKAEARDSYADLVSRVAPAVVTIRSQRMVRQTQLPYEDELFRRFFGEQGPRQAPRPASGLGSGVIVSSDGYILTNHHVVNGAQKIRVDFTDGRTFDARVVGSDQPSDLAVLKIAANNLPTVPVGDSDSARVGDVVLAVGNPLGIGQTVTMGIVSAKGRATGASEGAFEDFIQTDAPINQGNSGGALINTRGELIGINSQIVSPVGYNIGIGFAIPTNMANRVMDQLIKTGQVRRGQLGVTVQGVDADMAKSLGLSDVRGAIVSDVQAGSPAARAGLQEGDVILALDGKPIDSSNDLRNHIAPLGPDANVTLSVLRDGRKHEITATLSELPSPSATRAERGGGEPSSGEYGMAVQPLTPDVARELQIAGEKGVVVADVDPDGAAAEAGLQSGDVITQVNGKAVASIGELRTALRATPNDKPALLLVARDGRKVFLTLDNDRS